LPCLQHAKDLSRRKREEDAGGETSDDWGGERGRKDIRLRAEKCKIFKWLRKAQGEGTRKEF